MVVVWSPNVVGLNHPLQIVVSSNGCMSGALSSGIVVAGAVAVSASTSTTDVVVDAQLV